MKRQKKGGGGANWMDTYGDMVTLLLCFFVLLYSMSTIDENKWKALVQSFNPNASPTQTEIKGGNDGPSSDDEPQSQEQVEQDIEKLYQSLKQYAQENQLAQDIDVVKGDGYVFVSFNEAVFFDGDSYVLRPEGEQVLDTFAGMLSSVSGSIDEVRIMGHTAQATADTPNDPTVDRFLSTNRAAVATVYIQQHSNIDPARLVSVGYGQHRPVDSNATEATRAHNRRVEIIITGVDVYSAIGDSVEQYYSLRDGTAKLETDAPAASAEPAASAAPAK